MIACILMNNWSGQFGHGVGLLPGSHLIQRFIYLFDIGTHIIGSTLNFGRQQDKRFARFGEDRILSNVSIKYWRIAVLSNLSELSQ